MTTITKMAAFIGHWWLRDLEIATQSYDPKNVQHNLMIAQITNCAEHTGNDV